MTHDYDQEYDLAAMRVELDEGEYDTTETTPETLDSWGFGTRLGVARFAAKDVSSSVVSPSFWHEAGWELVLAIWSWRNDINHPGEISAPSVPPPHPTPIEPEDATAIVLEMSGHGAVPEDMASAPAIAAEVAAGISSTVWDRLGGELLYADWAWRHGIAQLDDLASRTAEQTAWFESKAHEYLGMIPPSVDALLEAEPDLSITEASEIVRHMRRLAAEQQ